MYKLAALALGLLTVALLFGCNMHEEKGNTHPLSSAKFAQIQAKILQPKCVSCHSPGGSAESIDLSTHANVMQSRTVVPFKPESSPFYLSVTNGRMPKGKAALEEADVELIASWIKEGALELEQTKPTPTATPIPEPSYHWLAENIFRPKCMVCHNTEKPRGKVDLSSYAALIASEGKLDKPIVAGDAERSGVYLEIAASKMPPTPKMLSTDETTALHDWIANGALEVTPGASTLPGPGEPNPPQPTYEWLSKNIFSRRCASCHGIPFKVAKIDFTTYETLLASSARELKALVPGSPEKSAIFREVARAKMPPPRNTLSEDEVGLVKQWIQAGALNN